MFRRSGVLACLLLAVAVLPLAGQEAEGLYASGQQAFRDGLYLMAARSLRQLAEKYPDHPLADDAEYLEALAEYYQQGYARLLAVLKEFPRRHPRSPFNSQVPFWLGSAHFQLGQYAQAAAQLAAQVERFPAEKEYGDRALLLRGAALEKLGEWGGARDAYRRLLDGGAEAGLLPEAWFRLGSAQLSLQDYAAAFSSFTRVVVEHADSPQAEEAVFYAAESLFFAGRFAEAERRYRLALAGEPPAERVETCLYRLARLLSKLERPAEALATAGELERRFPRGPYAPEYPLLAAEALFDLGQYSPAQTAYRRALAAAAPADRQRISYSLALAALAGGTPEAALQPLRDCLAGGDAGVAEQAAFRLAAALTALGREAEALKTVGDFRQRYPASRLAAEALALEAALLDRAGRGREARELYTRLLARYPDPGREDEVLFRRGSSFLAAGDTSSALKDFFAVVRGHPGSAYLAESRYNIGHVYSERGEFTRALPYFAEVVRQGGELAGRAMLASGVCRFNAGEYEQALSWFRRLAELPGEADLQAQGLKAQGLKAQGWYYGGRALYKLERLEEAEGAFGRAARAAGPQREEALYWRAVSLFRLDRPKAARQAFLELESAFPGGPRAAEALYRAGMCAALGGEHPAALALFERARAAGPGRELLQEILLQKGLSLLDSSGREEAAAAFRSLAREFPGSGLAADGLLALAEADLRAGDYAEALAGFRQLAKDYAGRPAARGARYWAGVAAARQGLAEEGLEHLLAYLSEEPGGGLAKAAVEEIRRILAETADPADRVLKGFLARVEASGVPPALKQQARLEYARYVLRRDRERGLALLSSLRDSEPEEPVAGEVHYWIGEAYRQRGDLARALEIFSGIAAARADRTGALAQAGLARVREEQGRREEAAEEYLKVYFLYPELKDLAAEGLYQAGRLYREQGLRERADRLFEKLRAEFPEREEER